MNKAYLLLGPEEGDKKEKLDAIKREIKASCPDHEEESYYASDDSASSILSSLSSGISSRITVPDVSRRFSLSGDA